MARTLGLPALLGPSCRARDLVLALIVSRVVRPASKLATAAWWPDVTLGLDLDVAGATTDEIYAAMDWLLERQDAIEAKLAAKHLGPEVNPSRMALFDLTSSWVTGRCCELAARGYSRDGKKGCEQIEYGILTDPAGRPVAVRVFEGNTADPVAFTEIVEVIRDTFGIENLVLVGDRGMITSARIDALRELNDDPDTATDFGWITALRAPDIAKLAADDGPLQMSLFDTQDIAEITHPDFPGERLIACRNPQLAAERTRKRNDLLAATEKLLEPIIARVTAGRLAGADTIGVAVGKVINKHKMAKHFDYTITDTSLAIERRHDQIAAEAALDGIYVLRTSVHADQLDAAGVVIGYKNLAHIERDFRIIKVDDLDLRPIHHRLDDRVRAHVLICMLACYLVWHLRKAWAPMTFTDEHPPQPRQPGRPRTTLHRGRHQGHHPARSGGQPATQLPRPARSPGHPHPQPDPLPPHRHRNPHAHRPHPRSTPRFRPHRHTHPPHRRVVRHHHTENHEPPAQHGIRNTSPPQLRTSGGPCTTTMQRSRPPILAATSQLTNLTVPCRLQVDVRALGGGGLSTCGSSGVQQCGPSTSRGVDARVPAGQIEGR